MPKTLAQLDKDFQFNKAFSADTRQNGEPEKAAAASNVEEQLPSVPVMTLEEAMCIEPEETADISLFCEDEPYYEDDEQLELDLPQPSPRIYSLAELDAQFRARNEVAENVETEQAIDDIPLSGYRRVFSAISGFIFYAVMLLLVVAAFLITQNGKLPFTSDYHLYSVITSSMNSVYPKGSALVVKATDPNELVVGNDITFFSASTSIITHRIVEIHEDFIGRGQRAFVTKGVDNPSPDRDYVQAHNVVGKVVFFVPGVGEFLWTLQSKLHMIIIFFIAGVGFSIFLNMTLGETLRERKIRKAKAVLRNIKT